MYLFFFNEDKLFYLQDKETFFYNFVVGQWTFFEQS